MASILIQAAGLCTAALLWHYQAVVTRDSTSVELLSFAGSVITLQANFAADKFKHLACAQSSNARPTCYVGAGLHQQEP